MAGQKQGEGATGDGCRAVVCVRISGDPSGNERGVDRQEQDCRALAEAQRQAVRYDTPDRSGPSRSM